MKTLTKRQLNKILKDHQRWLCSNGAKGERAYLINIDLSQAYIRDLNLCEADLRDADLRDANLNGADLRGTDLRGADLCGAKNNYPIACPEKGSFIGFKKAKMLDVMKRAMECIVELEIPADALRSSATTRKCRCSKAKVLSITNLDGTDADTDVAYSNYDPSFIYKIGEIVEVPDFDTNRWNECSTGIHFFITRQEAVDY